MMRHVTLKEAIEKFGGYEFINSGEFEEDKIAWIKMRYQKDEAGYRSMEFLAYLSQDMKSSGDPISFFPTSPPPHMNDPGTTLCFVVELDHGKMDDAAFGKLIKYLNWMHDEDYQQCKP